MEDALAIALGKESEESESEDTGKQDELDAAATFRDALKGDDDEAVVDSLEALVRLIKRRK